MNFLRFSSETTNVFPMANSAAGGQLLTEFNLRSRESVETDPNVQYMIGQSFVHSQNDFFISKQTDTLGDTVSNKVIQISEGRGVINGHFVESLVPVTIDISEANAQINAENKAAKASGSSRQLSKLTGQLKIGLRTMYSTVPTMTGALMTENSDNMFEGIQIVILPEKEFILPSDSPENPNKVTAHLLLGSFKFVNGVIKEIKQNEEKIQSIDGVRIGNAVGFLSGKFIDKTGLNPKHHYVYSTKSDSTRSDYSTWCKADDALMVWDPNPILASTDDPRYSFSEESFFRFNPVTGKTELVMAHKQVDGMRSTSGESQLYADKVIPVPTASYLNGSGGAVDSVYTTNIKRIAESVSKFYQLPNGSFKKYVPTLSEGAPELPIIRNQKGWKPGDYVIVGSDQTVSGSSSDAGSPSTLYMVIPGKVTGVDINNPYIKEVHPLDVGENLTWESITQHLLDLVDWAEFVNNNAEAIEAGTINWKSAINKAISSIELVKSVGWKDIIENAKKKQSSAAATSAYWNGVIVDAWNSAWENYTTTRNTTLSEAEAKKTYYEGLRDTAKAAVEAAEAEAKEIQDAIDDAKAELDKYRQEYVIPVTTTYTSKVKAVDNKRGEITDAENTLASFNNNLHKAQEQEHSAKIRYDAARSSGASQGIITEYERKWQIKMAEVAECKSKIASQNSKIESLNAQLSNLTADMNNYETEELNPVKEAEQERVNTYNELLKNKETKDKSLQNLTTELRIAEDAYKAWQAKEADAKYVKMIADNAFRGAAAENQYFPIKGWVDLIKSNIDNPDVDWSTFITNHLSEGVAYTSEVDWNKVIRAGIAKSGIDAINWSDVFAQALIQKAKQLYDDDWNNLYVQSVPEMLSGGLELGFAEADILDDLTDKDTLYELLGIGEGFESPPRGRKGIDYFRIRQDIDDDEEGTGTVRFLFYVVDNTTDYEYTQPPIMLTGGVPLAEEEVIGGFYNVPDTQLGAGYVYRDSDGHLRLLDYDLLATGVLAYQLGENYTSPAGLASSEIQINLDEYVNNRVAFPNQAQIAFTEKQASAGLVGAYVDPSVIHIYLDLSEEEQGYEINIHDIDSRFDSSVYLHISGTATENSSVNIINCQKIRIDVAEDTKVKVNLYSSCLYYDGYTIDRLNYIRGMSLWYKQFTSDDPNILVQGMTVELASTPNRITNEEFWSEETPNDNHYSYGLKGLVFSPSGDIVGMKILISDDITGNVEEGTYISSFEFKLPQSLGLSYPEKSLTKTVKVTGSFITAYPIQNPDGYCVKTNSFTALTYPYSKEDSLAGVLSIKANIEYITNVYGFNKGRPLDGWESGQFHVFEGGSID